MAYGLIPATGTFLVNLSRGHSGVSSADAEHFHRAAAQLAVAEGFAAVFLNDPQFRAPSRIVEPLVAACPDRLAGPLGRTDANSTSFRRRTSSKRGRTATLG